MMRLSGLESGAARLKKREERGMGNRPPSIATSFDHQSESDRDDEEPGDDDDDEAARSPEAAASFGSYASPLLASHKASAAIWHAPPSLHGHHDADMNGGSATWRDVIISSSATAANDDMLPPLGSTVTPTPAASKRKKTKKEVFICHEPNCGKQFPRSFALRRHMRIHTGTKPYACDFEGCTQRFNTSGNLSRHKRIHSGERPYPCIFSTCGKKFNTSTKLKRHMRIHFPEGQNVFRCVGLNCSWSCDNYKEFAAHQKLQHNIIVGAGLEAVSANAAAALTTAATSAMDHGADDRNQYGDQSAADAQGYSGNGYLYGYGKQTTLPSSSSSRKHNSNAASSSSSNSSGQYNYDSFASLSGLARETKHKSNQDGGVDHLYGDHHRRGKSSSSSAYTLPTTSFPSADAASAHYASSRGSSGLPSMYESSSSTLAISSESASSYGAPSLRSAGLLFGHTLRHDENNSGAFKSEQHDGHYDHQPHPHASPAHHHILRPPPPPSSHHHDQDGMKFGSAPPPMNPAAAEFTGEELSVVLELMKDSYY